VLAVPTADSVGNAYFFNEPSIGQSTECKESRHIEFEKRAPMMNESLRTAGQKIAKSLIAAALVVSVIVAVTIAAGAHFRLSDAEFWEKTLCTAIGVFIVALCSKWFKGKSDDCPQRMQTDKDDDLAATQAADKPSRGVASPKMGGTNSTVIAQPAVRQARPWIRFWARMFDIWVFGFIFAFFAVGLAAIVAPESNLQSVIFDKQNELWFGMTSLFAWVFVEATLLSVFGTTPGKLLFNIKLIPPSGSVPTFGSALARSVAVWWRGVGTGFPLISLFTLMSAHSRLKERGITSWDSDEGFSVVHERIGVARGLLAAGCFGAWFFLMAASDVGHGTAGASAAKYELSQKQKAIAAISAVQTELARSESQLAESDLTQISVDRPSTETPKSREELGELERFLLGMFSAIQSQQNDYMLELEAIGWTSILDPRRIKHDTALAESRVMVRQAGAIVDKYEGKTAKLISDFRKQIPALPFDETAKLEMLAGFDKGMKDSRISELWNLEKQVVDQVDSIITLLTTAKYGEDWAVEGNDILFVNDYDLATFHAHIETIQSSVRKQEQIRKDSITNGNQKLEEAKRIFTEWGT
jgi:hypothetical protein